MGGWDSDTEIPSDNKNKNTQQKPQQQQQKQNSQQQQQQQQRKPLFQQSSSSSGYKPKFIKADKSKVDDKKKQQIELQKNDKGEKKIIYRTKQGVFISNCYIEVDKNHQNNSNDSKKIFDRVDHMHISNDQNYLLMATLKEVYTYDIKNEKLVNKIEGCTVIENICLSNSQKYAQFVNCKAKDQYEVCLFTFPELKEVKIFKDLVYVRENFPPVKFTQDDGLAFKYNYKKQVINVFQIDDKNDAQVIKQFHTGVIDHFDISNNCNKNPTFHTVFLQKMKGYEVKEGILNIYELDKDKPVLVKILEKAQEVSPVYSPDGKYILIKIESSIDKNNNSYYGENRLFHYEISTKKFSVIPTFKGYVHDYKWSNDSETFCVLSGSMPATAVIFDKLGKPLFELGQMHKNTIFMPKQSNHRFLLFAGLGNLNGQMEVWDIKLKKKVSECKSQEANMCKWSNDGRKFLTNVVTPVLRVDNNFKIYSFDGQLVHKAGFNHTELYQVEWLEKNREYPESDKPPTPEQLKAFEQNQIEKKNTQSQAKFGGGSSFADELRQMKQSDTQTQAKQVNSQGSFAQKTQMDTGAKLKPGQSAQPEKKPKKKRIRKKDMQKRLEDLKDAADDL